MADAYERLAKLGLLPTSEAGDLFLHRPVALFVLSFQVDNTAQIAVEQVVSDEAN